MLTSTPKYSQEEYEHAKQVVLIYEESQRNLKKITGRSECPFCGGSKTKPFMGAYKNQNCTDCDKNGTISNKVLYQLDILDFVKK